LTTYEETRDSAGLRGALMAEILEFFGAGSGTTNIQPQSLGIMKAMWH